jgi:NADH-quinone oxidoreductase subunit N
MIGLLTALLGAVTKFDAPDLDYHALAPELALATVAAIVLLVDLFVDETRKHIVTTVAGAGLALCAIPILTLAADGADRSLFGGAFVVDNFALAMKALFIFAGYVVLLMSANYLSEGDYHEGEYSFLMLCSLLGMLVMASSRDLIMIFIALETLSIPAYLLAGWRKRDLKSNEAMLKYYLLGVIASAIMLYGMSLVYGLTGATQLTEISESIKGGTTPLLVVGIFMIIAGFAFKVSAVPFHQWAPDTYEGAPTPITAFLSVASKAAGFVALINLVYFGFWSRANIMKPIFWVLAAATMIVGNLIALRQTNIVRMLAYSSVAQAGFIMAPFAVAEQGETAKSSFDAVVLYLLVYTLMNLGAFIMVVIVARKTKSGEISSFGGLFSYAPLPAVMMTIFMFALAGIPPLGGFWAKFYVFKSLMDGGSKWGLILALIGSISSVIAFFYYASVMREMWMRPVPDGDRTAIRIPSSLKAAMAICAIAIVVVGVFPSVFTRMVNTTFLDTQIAALVPAQR